MGDTISIRITRDGNVESIYKDEMLPVYDALGLSKITRASHVEFENDGWTVRAAHNPDIAIRKHPHKANAYCVGRYGAIVVFQTRERALKAEVDMFWDLIPPKEKR